MECTPGFLGGPLDELPAFDLEAECEIEYDGTISFRPGSFQSTESFQGRLVGHRPDDIRTGPSSSLDPESEDAKITPRLGRPRKTAPPRPPGKGKKRENRYKDATPSTISVCLPTTAEHGNLE